jgi:hypothetical protein
MTRSRKKRPGVGAKAACRVSFLHPSAPLREAYATDYKRKHLDNFLVVGSSTERLRRGGKAVFALHLRHDDFHYRGRHQVDDHNNRRGGGMSFDKSWKTTYWPNRHFAFHWAASETNACLAQAFAKHAVPEPQVAFRRRWAFQALNNRYLPDGTVAPLPQESETTVSPRTQRLRQVVESHKLSKIPRFRGRYRGGGRWKVVRTKFLQQKCVVCNKRVRTYCSCDPHKIVCDQHYGEHIATLT